MKSQKSKNKKDTEKEQTRDEFIQMRVQPAFKKWLDAQLELYGIKNRTAFLQALSIIYLNKFGDPHLNLEFESEMNTWMKNNREE